MRKVPKLRFPEYHEDWEQEELGAKGEFFRGSSLSKDDLSSEGSPCILYGELYTSYDETVRAVNSKTDRHFDNPVYGSINDVLIPSSGETAIDIAKAVCLLVNNVLIGGDLNIFRSSQLNGLFLSYQLNHKKRIDIAKIAQGASIFHLYSNSLKKLLIEYPSLPEQTKIASFLSYIDAKIDKQKEKVNAFEEYKKGLLRKIFSQEIRFKDDDGSEYPNWSEKRVDEVINISPVKVIPHSDGNVFRCIELEHIDSVSGRINGYSESMNQLSMKNKFEKGQVLYGKLRPYLRKYWHAEFDGLCSSEIWVLDGICITNTFLSIIVQTELFNQYACISCGSKMPRADWNFMRKQPINIPQHQEQVKIANFLFLFGTMLDKEKTKIDLLREFKKGLLQQMFV